MLAVIFLLRAVVWPPLLLVKRESGQNVRGMRSILKDFSGVFNLLGKFFNFYELVSFYAHAVLSKIYLLKPVMLMNL